MPFIPHTSADIESMLASMGVASVEALFDEIPAALRAKPFTNIPEGMNEMKLLQHVEGLASEVATPTCFLGAGAYDHHIPAAVWDIVGRGEYLTAYTPYQAEASQGTLQLLYEFQTMIAELTGMDVANASLYDGASALAEAVFMAVRLQKSDARRTILVPKTLHPLYRKVLDTIVSQQNIVLSTLPYDAATGQISLGDLPTQNQENIAAIILMHPNFFGVLEPVDEVVEWAKKHQIYTIACVNPMSLAWLNPPGVWGGTGVDIVCGEGQPLGIPMASGGPYMGFLSARMEHVRQMPGRIIGRTVDALGNPGFTLTLQAREQHIRRSKATSNICTNQGLLVTAATIYMSMMGAEGMLAVAQGSHRNTLSLVEQLTALPGVTQKFDSPFFHEAVLHFAEPLEPIFTSLLKEGILAGLPLGNFYPELKNCLLVCATEKRTEADIEKYIRKIAAMLTKRETACSLSK
ncbi:MAG: aminomethyl-transferring glycine dehydrogenase subunit GcvPA [Legionellaceae bacterium]|nr:aminomethyl-transferring glycine dehydrogenase subunit GcvPA [Legionellaceae bacterium]